MGEFLELSRSEISQLVGNLLVKRLPKSALLYNITRLYFDTKMDDFIPTKFYAYNGNIDGEDAFVLAKQDKKKYYNAVSWTLCGPEAKYVTSEMFKSFEVLVDWTIRNSLTAIHVDIRDGMANMCRKHGTLVEYGPANIFWRRSDEIVADYTNSSSKNARNVTVVELDAEGVRKLINSWDYASFTSFDEILDNVGFAASAGVKIDDELVTWAYTSTDGAIHALFTIESHRGKGYSKLLLRSMSEMLAKKGMHVITHVDGQNLPSAKLMLSVGFQRSYSMYWMEYTPNSSQGK